MLYQRHESCHRFGKLANFPNLCGHQLRGMSFPFLRQRHCMFMYQRYVIARNSLVSTMLLFLRLRMIVRKHYSHSRTLDHKLAPLGDLLGPSLMISLYHWAVVRLLQLLPSSLCAICSPVDTLAVRSALLAGCLFENVFESSSETIPEAC